VESYQVRDILTTAVKRLTKAGSDTPQLDAEVLLAYSLNKDRSWLYLHPEANLQEAQQHLFFDLVARREQREPVAYLVGRKAFFGLEFLVTADTLIPRPETELLVETALHHTALDRPVTIADIGTGSGCIAVALAKYRPLATIFAIDVSPQALQVARQNAERHQLVDQIRFLRGDLLSPLPAPVDLIVSNPPYIAQSELAPPFTPPEVHRYEPRTALAGGDDGLAIIRKLLLQAREKLNPTGLLLMEIGSTQGQAVKLLAEAQFSNAKIQIVQDLAGLDRLLVVQRES
jgi:release factor glutamine methyltransferase